MFYPLYHQNNDMKTNETKSEAMSKRVFNLIVVDESGSMSIIREQALIGLNETLDTIIKLQEQHPELEQRVTLLTFDSGHRNLIFDNESAQSVRPLKRNEYNPGGGTPLYDAIGLGIAKVNAITSTDDRVLVTIITDGWENCSTEYNLYMIKNLIEKLKKQQWTFTFIGTDNLDVEGMAADMGIKNSLRFKQTPTDTLAMFACERKARSRHLERVLKEEDIPEDDFFSGV